MRTRASILVGLLWCLALLSIVVIGFLHTTRLDLQLGKNYGDRIQAHYLALAAVEKAKALLYKDAQDRSRSHRNHSGDYYDAPNQFRNVSFGRGTFQVLRRARDDEGGGIIYGVSDEESRLNVNSATTNALSNLEDMTPDIFAAIADWRDADNAVTPGGAESEYYLSLQPPYQARNGPLQTVRELLMVRGVTPELLLANDRGQNGLLDVEDENGEEVFVHPQAGDSDLGWAGLLTVDSSVRNVNAAGEDRVDIQGADQSALTRVTGITAEIARAIVSYRGRNQFQTIVDLLDVTNTPPRGASGASASTGADSASAHPVSETLLMDIGDEVKVGSNDTLPGAININTAGLEVLICLPGVDRQLAQAIISYRQSSGFFPNIAWLLKVPGMTQAILKQIAPLVTARSETYRILGEGTVRSSGIRQRVEMIVHIDLTSVRTLEYREDGL